MKIQIPSSSMGAFKAFIAKLNRKAEKFAVPHIFFTVGEETVKNVTVTKAFVFDGQNKAKRKTFPIFVREVEIARDQFKIGEFCFVAKVETLVSGKNVFHSRPENAINIPEKYILSGCSCEHCNVNRQRKDTYLIQNAETLEFKQVGSTCLKDFMGVDCVSAFAFESEIYQVIFETSESFMNEGESLIDVKDTIEKAVAIIEERGFISSKKAFELGRISTASMFPNLAEKTKVTELHQEKASQIISWVSSFDLATLESDYLKKIYFLVDAGICSPKNLPILVSVVSAFDYSKEASKKPAGEFVGTVGEKGTWNLTCEKVVVLPDYGFGISWINSFSDENGNKFVWKTNKLFHENERVTLKGSIKEHSEFKGVKQTVLTRCKVL